MTYFINPRALPALFTLEVMWESNLSSASRKTFKLLTEHIRSRDLFWRE